MPLETLDRAPPPFFKQGPSALSRLLFFSVLALFLMVADARFHMVQPLRTGIATVLYGAQWVVLQPVQWGRTANLYITGLNSARRDQADARALLVTQSSRAGQVEALLAENQHLRALLELRQRVNATEAATAQVLYDATDPYTRQVVIDKGRLQGIQRGAPVIDESGVVGQVTNVYPFVSEVTLLVDRDQVIPVFNPRTGMRSIAYGNPTLRGGVLELRYVSTTDDVQVGDLLTTSGIDGVYPPGLPVARVLSMDRQADTSFARILCQPLAHLSGVTQVMVLQPVEKPSEDSTQADPQLPPLVKASDVASTASSRAAASGAGRAAPRLAYAIRAAREHNARDNARAARASPAPVASARPAAAFPQARASGAAARQPPAATSAPRASAARAAASSAAHAASDARPARQRRARARASDSAQAKPGDGANSSEASDAGDQPGAQPNADNSGGPVSASPDSSSPAPNAGGDTGERP